jgi:hypothetical protein
MPDAQDILALSEAMAGLPHAVETAEHPTSRGLLLKSMRAVAERIISEKPADTPKLVDFRGPHKIGTPPVH